jgi:hypothetical protein
MDILSRVRQAAEVALEELRQRAQRESWDTARIEREKQLFQLRTEVTLCSAVGCLNMVEPLPGFRDLICAGCQRDNAP